MLSYIACILTLLQCTYGIRLGGFRPIPIRLPDFGFPPRIFFPPQRSLPFPTAIRPTPGTTTPSVRYEHSVIVPKVFRVGATETVILNLYEYTSASVTAYLRDLPGRQHLFSQLGPIQLDATTSREPVRLSFKVNDGNIPVFRKNQRVQMVIQVRNSGSDFTETLEVEVTKKSGYLFVQTDRPIYRPTERVEIRIYPLEQDMSPEKENLVEIIVKTPDGIGAYKRIRRLPPFGFVEAVFHIAENPIFGTWSVEAKYSSNGYNTTAEAKFVIRKYVLPTFNVKIDMSKNFLLVTDNAITGHIRANYSYGEPVEGNYFITMKLKRTPLSEPVEFYKMPGAGSFLVTAFFENGEQLFDIPVGDLLDNLLPGETLETLADNSASIFIEATVNARADGIMESDITADMPILKTPYVIDTSLTTKYYTPGLSYRMQATIRDITNGKPKSGASIRVSVGAGSAGTRIMSNGNGEISTFLDFGGSGSHDVIIETALDGVADEDQSRATVTVAPYTSPSNNFLQIAVADEPARVNQGNYFLTFKYQPTPPSQIRYIILARGTILTSGTNTPNAGSSESTQLISVTQTMVPSARVIAYHMVGDEVVSSSIWFDVVDQCKEELTVEVPEQVLPGASVPFTIRGAPQSVVSVSGVDKAAYFLYEQNRLTRRTMFNEMDNYDTGCVRSGGSDGPDVFIGAGLQIYGTQPSSATSPSCEGDAENRRKKRNAEVISPRELERKLAQCARDGKRESPTGEGCETRGRRCRYNFEDQYPGCWKRFRDGCLQANRERQIKERLGLNGTGNQAEAEASVEGRRSAFEDDDASPWTVTLTAGEQQTVEPVAAAETHVEILAPVARPRPPPTSQIQLLGGSSHSFAVQAFKPKPAARPITATTTTTAAPTPVTGLRRSDFRETLSWPTIQIQNNGEHRLYRRARDSITTFVIGAVGMADSEDGFCVPSSTELRVFKDVFVQLNTPYSLKKQEQAQLRIVVFNYNRDIAQNVIVRVKPEQTYCSRFLPDIWSELIRMDIAAGDSGSASLSVFPLRIPRNGRAAIEIEIRNLDNVLLDSIKKDILIEPEGEIKDTYQSYPLDLKTENQDTFQINFNFPEQFVPDTRQCWIYAYTNFMGPTIEIDPVSKEPRDIKSIFRRPYGCGEQNMLVTGPNVYAHMYLQAANKILPGTNQYEQSLLRIEDGFNRELMYRSDRVNKRAWAVFTHYLPSTWLNAYVDRVFIQGKMYHIDMDITPICSSLEWMLGEQEGDGHFREQRPPLHREMHGAVGGELSLTAYVLITLVDAEGLCSSQLNDDLLAARNRAVAFLDANKNNVAFQRTYGAALLSYALSLHDPNSAFAREINTRLLALQEHSTDMRHIFWSARPVDEITGTDIHAYWYTRKPQAVDIEATSYALLAIIEIARAKDQVEQSDLNLTRKVVLWLISQRNEAGAFISTQDTVVGLQALATYQIWINQIDPQSADVEIRINLQGQANTAWTGEGHSFVIDEMNEGLRKEVEVPEDVVQAGGVTVMADGHGEGVLSYRCIYRTVVDEEGCHFQVSQNVAIVRPAVEGGRPMQIKLTLTISKPVGPPAEASIVDVGLMSGFTALESSLDLIAIPDVVDGTVERFEITSQNVILYLNKIGSDPINIAFLMEQQIPVENSQPAKINIYDYYEPSVQCGTYYSLPGQISLLRTSNCEGENESLCKCAEGICPVCRTRGQQLHNTSCLTRHGALCETCDDSDDCDNMFEKACRSNFAYVVNITRSPQDDDVTSDTVFVSFTGKISEILKIGDETPDRNSQRTFTTRNDCYAKCKDPALTPTENQESHEKYFREGRLLLIYGRAPEKFLDRNGNVQNHYRLADDTLIERIIPRSKCESTVRNIVKSNLQCDNPNYPRNGNKEAKCIRLKKLREACSNMDRLRQLLLEGCDK